MRILPRDMRPHVRLEDVVILHKAMSDLMPGQAVLQFIEVLKSWPLFGASIFEISVRIYIIWNIGKDLHKLLPITAYGWLSVLIVCVGERISFIFCHIFEWCDWLVSDGDLMGNDGVNKCNINTTWALLWVFRWLLVCSFMIAIFFSEIKNCIVVCF